MDQRPLFPGNATPPERPAPAKYRGPSPKGSLVLATAGVLTAALLGAFVSARSGALAIAVTLAAAGTWRAVAPRTSYAAGIAVRSKMFDVVLYLGTAAAIAFLALTVPYLG
ncbi:hypothetical protein Xcel_0740 [Xylanimonas cellulosilytica DSM 15894]|uniref:DUF3017 domain-containing protein n=1 Tax=Xylanimonas cellulosilytica (strain DSM 15894 / JCM 12276 / CECT 5975 / KCTC 9989 / LMG 20990 / NBRC 107835 / XIL07) TaxID=446471 RepID=D1BXG9_XYLCX|nr:DUF3017 domain-containing protein [Xylanimonas cellulosilytica]ACZ29779.1 hypothetical protein Xcel_0740 [Xylanimonas cellulosilytica DSM 15894]